MLPKSVPSSKGQLSEPLCDANFPVSMATFDHLTGVRHRDKIDYKAESALEEALNALIFDKERIDTDEVARILSHALKSVIFWTFNSNPTDFSLFYTGGMLFYFRIPHRGC